MKKYFLTSVPTTLAQTSTGTEPLTRQALYTLKPFALKKAFRFLPTGSVGSMGSCSKNVSGCLRVLILLIFNTACSAQMLSLDMCIEIPAGTAWTGRHNTATRVTMNIAMHNNGLSH